MIEQLQVEHALSLATELHQDHWPSWLIALADRVRSGDAWLGGQTTALAIACVGRPAPSRSTSAAKRRSAVLEQLIGPLREALHSPTEAKPEFGEAHRTAPVSMAP